MQKGQAEKIWKSVLSAWLSYCINILNLLSKSIREQYQEKPSKVFSEPLQAIPIEKPESNIQVSYLSELH